MIATRFSALLVAGLLTAGLAGIALAQSESKDRVAPSAEEIEPLEVGEKVPDVTLKNADGEEVSLREAISDAPAAIVFYRGGWCPYCVKQLQALRDATADLSEAGYRILALSPESPETLKELLKEKELDYTLLSDAEMKAAKGFGVAFDLGAVKTAAYKGYGATAPDGTLPVPSVFLAKQDGEIVFAHADADYKVRLSNEALVAAARENAAD